MQVSRSNYKLGFLLVCCLLKKTISSRTKKRKNLKSCMEKRKNYGAAVHQACLLDNQLSLDMFASICVCLDMSGQPNTNTLPTTNLPHTSTTSPKKSPTRSSPPPRSPSGWGEVGGGWEELGSYAVLVVGWY